MLWCTITRRQHNLIIIKRAFITKASAYSVMSGTTLVSIAKAGIIATLKILLASPTPVESRYNPTLVVENI